MCECSGWGWGSERLASWGWEEVGVGSGFEMGEGLFFPSPSSPLFVFVPHPLLSLLSPEAALTNATLFLLALTISRLGKQMQPLPKYTSSTLSKALKPHLSGYRAFSEWVGGLVDAPFGGGGRRGLEEFEGRDGLRKVRSLDLLFLASPISSLHPPIPRFLWRLGSLTVEVSQGGLTTRVFLDWHGQDKNVGLALRVLETVDKRRIDRVKLVYERLSLRELTVLLGEGGEGGAGEEGVKAILIGLVRFTPSPPASSSPCLSSLRTKKILTKIVYVCGRK